MDGLGFDFEMEVEAAVRAIRTYPKSAVEIVPGYRRKLLQTFPYGVVYRERAEEILIVAIAQLQRRPDYWLDRL